MQQLDAFPPTALYTRVALWHTTCVAGRQASLLGRYAMAAQLLKPVRSNSASNAIQSSPARAGPRLLSLRPCASGAMIESQLPTPFGTELVIRSLLEACISPAASVKLTTSLGCTTVGHSSQGGGLDWADSAAQPKVALLLSGRSHEHDDMN